MQGNDKPRHLVDRDNNQDLDYFFISYSHRDKNVVFPILANLYEQGISFWYDDGLNVGDVWDEKVKVKIENEKCIGCIFFFSSNSLASEAVYKEIEVVLAKHNVSKNFVIAPIFINITNFKSCVEIIFANCSGNFALFNKTNADLSKLLMVEGDEAKRIFYQSDSPELLKQILKVANQVGATFDSGPKKFLKLDNVNRINDDIELSYGKYVSNNTKEDVKWRLFKKNQNIAYFVTEYCYVVSDYTHIDKNYVYDNLKGYAATDSMILFDNKNYVKSINVISDEIIRENNVGEAILSDSADALREQKFRSFWVFDTKNQDYVLYNSNNCPIANLTNKYPDFYKITAGIRYVLEIDDNLIDGE